MPFIKQPDDSDHDCTWLQTPVCRHPEHNPPMHLVMKPGLYVYVCPACGSQAAIEISYVQMKCEISEIAEKERFTKWLKHTPYKRLRDAVAFYAGWNAAMHSRKGD